jgi:CheY-like chemotaxis protein
MAKVILYVEDEDDDALLMQHAFKKAGMSETLVVVKDGKAALDYLAGQGEYADRKRHPMPNIVLLDLNLPIHSGFEVIQWIRQQSVFPTLLVVPLTSSGNEIDIHRAYELGANAYLIKPPSADGLAAMVKLFREFWLNLNEPPPNCRNFRASD